MKTKSNIGRIIISIPLGIMLVIFISANILNTSVNDGCIKVYGLYGKKIEISDITDISLKNTIPKIKKVSNGIILASGKRKGYFTAGDKGVSLYLYNLESPFIYIETKDGEYYLNLNDSDETKEVYKEIIKEKS